MTSSKIHENALTKCNKCECLILSDSSDPGNDKCIDPRQLQQFSDDSQSDEIDKIVIRPTCHSTVKISVKQQCDECPLKEKSTSTDNSLNEKNGKKRLCFRFCRKKKDKVEEEKVPVEEEKGKPKDQKNEMNQTSKVAVNNTKTQMSTPNLSDLNVEEITSANSCKHCGKPGCNTNTIIIPREKFIGDGVSNLEHFLKLEAKSNSRYLEDIIAEIHKQRREIHELKDMLDTIVRGLREQLFMTTFAKEKTSFFEEFCRNTCLERKSNTLSLAKSKKSVSVSELNKKTDSATADPTEDKKKRRFFPWCK